MLRHAPRLPRAILLIVGFLTGCGQSDPLPLPAPVPAPIAIETPAPAQAAAQAPPAAPAAAPAAPPVEDPLPSISLSGSSPQHSESAVPGVTNSSAGASPDSGSAISGQARRREVVAALKYIQTLLGAWEAKTRRDVKEGLFKGMEKPSWVWDFRTDRSQPALVMQADDGIYMKSARLTYLPENELLQLDVVDADGRKRQMQGKFESPVEEFQGEDRRLHVRYKVRFTEVAEGDAAKDAWELVLDQQDNNRYLWELSRKRGSRFQRLDTVAAQRSGTSFALNDSDYKERTCIVSGGLGTSQVSFQGKSYWVCCSGCQAAFNDDPARWIAEAANKADAATK